VRRWWLAALVCGCGWAQQGSVENGARLYRANCAVPYCHGPEGAAGRAPKLAGHNHTINSMYKAITWGIPGTGMPEFTSRLKTGEIADIVAYMMTLRGAPQSPAQSAQTPRVPPPQAREGRALFFDAARAGSCGTCHELDGWGVAVGPDLAKTPPGQLENLRKVAQSHLRTARAAGEAAFPALVAEHTEARVRVYDLSAPLPVLRSFDAGGVTLSPNSTWRHEDVTRAYSDAELAKIRDFLRWSASGR
jgi:mono/diheme cytochrome c family protein